MNVTAKTIDPSDPLSLAVAAVAYAAEHEHWVHPFSLDPYLPAYAVLNLYTEVNGVVWVDEIRIIGELKIQ